MHSALEGLEPHWLWHYFSLVSSIPRCSGDEGPLRERLETLAQQRGLEIRGDEVGNLVIVIPPRPGCEAWPKVVLQGHLDMVCEKDGDSPHDFSTDGIALRRDGDWLRATGTTLGGDNGIAVAAALAMIDDAPPEHGQLELLFTVDEERGLSGATEIGEHMVQGDLLLNLDSEEEDTVTVGCAGGGDTIVTLPIARTALPADWVSWQGSIGGLTGGHSGLDILFNRANAIRCLGRLLTLIAEKTGGLRLCELKGGSKRNAIPREAEARFACPAGDPAALQSVVERLQEDLLAEYQGTDPELQLACRPVELSDTERAGAFDQATTENALALTLSLPSGVISLSGAVAGQAETSTNLGVVEQRGEGLAFVNCTRSSIGPALEAVRQQLVAIAQLAGADVSREPAYPGWAPDVSSELLATFKKVHQEVTGKEPAVMTIHAGLECGILGERFSGLEMISFGPTMFDVHSPKERLCISSSERFYSLLRAVLTALRPRD